MFDPLESWVPAIGGALAGAALFVYAFLATRRFDRDRAAVRAASAGRQIAKKIETPRRAQAPAVQQPATPPATTTTTVGGPSPTKPR